VQESVCISEQNLAGIGQRHWFGRAVEQRLADLLLQPADGDADGRLRSKKDVGRTRETTGLRNRHENLQLAELHKCPLWCDNNFKFPFITVSPDTPHNIVSKVVTMSFAEFEQENRLLQDLVDRGAIAADASFVEPALAGSPSTPTFELIGLQASAGTSGMSTALVTLRGPSGTRSETSTGNGPVHAVYNAIDRVTHKSGTVISYTAKSVASGRDAAAAVFLRVEFDGELRISGAVDCDIIHASARAYLGAVNGALESDTTRIEDLEYQALTSHATDHIGDWT
jgi:hypothetical protein